MDIATVDISSSFGSFTKPHSTSGGLLSYRVPPKTAIKGMLGAMAGLSFEETHELLDRLYVGIKPLKRPNTNRTTYNCHYGKRGNTTANVQEEILVKPKYRIYIDFSSIKNQGKLKQKIESEKGINSIADLYSHMIANSQTHFNVYMGRNNFPITSELVNESIERVPLSQLKDEVKVCTILPTKLCSKFKVMEKVETSDEKYSPNISMPDKLKIHVINDYPLEQSKDRKYTKMMDFFMKPPESSLELHIQLNKDEIGDNYRFLQNETGELIILV